MTRCLEWTRCYRADFLATTCLPGCMVQTGSISIVFEAASLAVTAYKIDSVPSDLEQVCLQEVGSLTVT
jgi:hypothetical protein